MIKRTLHFGNPAYLSLRDQQLTIELPHARDLGDEYSKRTVPIEDIGVIVLDHRQITITHACLAALIENKVSVITCNTTHHPTGMLLPLEGNDLQSERFRYQIDASLPLKKQLWQQTIQAKIRNQAALLSTRSVSTEPLLSWMKKVKSGDPDNYEARAAAYYWKHLFPNKLNFFRERDGNPPNNLLNYGYTILRAIVARGLVSSGLLPTLGIHHRNKYNAYCLADDIMEPYRPFVDQIVLKIVENGENFLELSTGIKAQLLSISGVDIIIDKQTSPLMVGLQRTTASLSKCYEGKTKKLIYPALPLPTDPAAK